MKAFIIPTLVLATMILNCSFSQEQFNAADFADVCGEGAEASIETKPKIENETELTNVIITCMINGQPDGAPIVFTYDGIIENTTNIKNSSITIVPSENTYRNDTNKSILKCAALELEVASERLKCYTQLAEDVFKAQMSINHNWIKYPQSDNPIDNSEGVFLYTVAVQGGTPHRDEPLLVLRCFNKELDAFIVWNEPIGEEKINVGYIIGSQELTTDTWYVSKDKHSTIFSLKEIYNIRFIEKLLSADKSFLVAYIVSQPSEKEIITVFNISGLHNVIDYIVRPCE